MGSNEKVLKENKPTADVLMSSMRSMGYTFEAAIADIIDNSVSVHATQIEIKFPVDPAEIYIAVCDNGTGMSKDELFDAMKYGSSLKRGKRSEDDLGRFGLGLKAASLDYKEAKSYRKERNGMLRQNQWHDLKVRVFM